MRTLARATFHLALSLWVGTLVAVSLLVAPAVFRAVPSETAGTVMGSVFPLYYAFTFGVGVIAVGAATYLWRRAARASIWRMIVPTLVLMLVATSYAGFVVSPRARELRPLLHREPVDPAVRVEFDALHRRAVQLNGCVLLLGLAMVIVVAATVRHPDEP